jgi:hypothetical protein
MKTYKDCFDHLGNRLDGMTAADEVICAIAIVVIAAILSGLLTGGL